MMNFSNIHRHKIIQKLKSMTYDVLVVGGGITGAGIALDATTRGMRTALVERQDFAGGTSSRSTKLIHGGLRYLKQLHLGLVVEVGRERKIVFENGPHVTKPQWMLLPVYKGGTFGKYTTWIGLSLYDRLAGVEERERKEILNPTETLQHEPLLKKEGLLGAGKYIEYFTDDARLTIEIIKEAVKRGGTALNYSKVVAFTSEKNQKLSGATVVDQTTGEQYHIRADKIINATGPWVDTIRKLDPFHGEKGLRLSKGVHIVIDRKKFPLKQPVYFDVPDGRMVFAIPRDGKTYVGTTDTFYHGDPAIPKMTQKDREYLLKAIHEKFPEVVISESDIESSWAGVRPLIWEEGNNPSEISRKEEIWESKSGLITIAGGKLTGYRKMAESTVDLIAKKFRYEKKKLFSNCITRQLPISGGNVGGSAKFERFVEEKTREGISSGLPANTARDLALSYGSNVSFLFKSIEKYHKKWNEYHLPLILGAKLQYALDHEMAVTPLDFFRRRTSALLFEISLVRKYKSYVINYMADYFQWNDQLVRKYTNQLESALLEAIYPVDEQ